jgi:DnaK suppressor protein
MAKKNGKINEPARLTQLRQILDERRRELQAAMRDRLRRGRDDRPADGRDDLEHSEADSQVELSLALLQMRSDTLTQIDLAIARLDAGRYGDCAECEEPIAERRLRVLPFAARCQTCETLREEASFASGRQTAVSPIAGW